MKHLAKKLGCLCLTLIMLLAMALPAAAEDLLIASNPNALPAWDGTVATAFAGGTGTEEDPYLVSNAAELAYLSASNNDGSVDYTGKYIKQTADINLEGALWTAIAYAKKALTPAFAGHYDGAGYTIYNIHCVPVDPSDTKTAIYSGLFGLVQGGSVRNVNMVGGTVESTKYSGAIAGYMKGGMIYNCTAELESVTGVQIGGILGRCDGSDLNEIKGCVNGSKVYSVETADNAFVGGIVGAAGNTLISYCANYGEIIAYAATKASVAGGMVGIQGADKGVCDIDNCVDIGTITAYSGAADDNYGAGGLIGKAGNVSFATISNSFTAGTYTCENTAKVGGIAGFIASGKIVTVENCYTNFAAACGTDEVGYFAEAKILKDNDMVGPEGIAKMGLNSAWVADGGTYPHIDVAKIDAAEQEPEPEQTTAVTTTAEPEQTTTAEPEQTTTEPVETTTEPEETTTEPEVTTAAPDETEPTEDPGTPTEPVEPKTRDNTVLIIILSIAIVAVAGGMVAVVIISKKKQ